MNCHVNDTNERKRKRILIMGSKSSYCVADLPHQGLENELEGEIVSALSNYDKLKEIGNWYDADFKKVAIEQKSRHRTKKPCRRTCKKWWMVFMILT
ncbi:MAG: hypothetical protein FXV80_05985 [Candidatus Thioglobus sp.]|nr:MAG: hypothetical protein FXV80_05985 [Candidatus Thioglobus sp.]